jgi:hypothetical protein
MLPVLTHVTSSSAAAAAAAALPATSAKVTRGVAGPPTFFRLLPLLFSCRNRQTEELCHQCQQLPAETLYPMSSGKTRSHKHLRQSQTSASAATALPLPAAPIVTEQPACCHAGAPGNLPLTMRRCAKKNSGSSGIHSASTVNSICCS